MHGRRSFSYRGCKGQAPRRQRVGLVHCAGLSTTSARTLDQPQRGAPAAIFAPTGTSLYVAVNVGCGDLVSATACEAAVVTVRDVTLIDPRPAVRRTPERAPYPDMSTPTTIRGYARALNCPPGTLSPAVLKAARGIGGGYELVHYAVLDCDPTLWDACLQHLRGDELLWDVLGPALADAPNARPDQLARLAALVESSELDDITHADLLVTLTDRLRDTADEDQDDRSLPARVVHDLIDTVGTDPHLLHAAISTAARGSRHV